jgi:hypothetical protein
MLGFKRLLLSAVPLSALLTSTLAPGVASASRLIYSYDSTTAITRQLTENGLTFIFDKTFVTTHVHKIIETQDVGEADLKSASEHDLGRSQADLLGEAGRSHDLYEITDGDNGPALIKALCPGADRAFLAIGPLKSGRDLTVFAIGVAKGRPGWLCETLDYGFHGEWALPQTPLRQPDRTDRFNDAPTNRPY